MSLTLPTRVRGRGLRSSYACPPPPPPPPAPVGLGAALALAITGGATLAVAFEPFGLWPGAIAGPAALVVALDGKRLRHSVVIGFVFGLAFHGVLLWWLAQSIGPGAWAGVVVVQAAWLALLGAAIRLTSGLPVPALWFALAWVGSETARSTWPWGGLPWGRVGFLVLDSPWSGLLPILGVSGAGLLIAAAAGLLGNGLTVAGRHRRLRFAGAGVLVILGLGPVAWPYDVASSSSIRVAVVQGNVPGDGRRLVAHHREVTDNHVRATKDLAEQVADGVEVKPDLVVWPENSTAVDPELDPRARQAIQGAVDAIDAPVLVGGMVDGPTPDTVLNQGIVWTTSGATGSRYTKRHPVPFGEYIPLRRYLGAISPRLSDVPRDMLPGTSSVPLNVGGARIADAICFDVAHDDVLAAQVRNGAQMVVVQTSNASFTGTAQLDQQFALTRARALETGRAVAVASTNGISALIAPTGAVIELAPRRETAVLAAEVPLVNAVTPAVRWGSVAGTIALALAAAGAAWGALGLAIDARRRRGDRPGSTLGRVRRG